MKKKILLFSLLILAISLIASSVSCATTPTEVERVKDVCYFKIKGKPTAPPAPPGEGTVEFIYKNLSGQRQEGVTIYIYKYLDDGTLVVLHPNTLLPIDDEYGPQSVGIPGDIICGDIIFFEVTAPGLNPTIDGVISVPPS